MFCGSFLNKTVLDIILLFLSESIYNIYIYIYDFMDGIMYQEI